MRGQGLGHIRCRQGAQSAHALAALADELGKAGSTLQVVEARSGVRDRLQTEGLAPRLGGINRFTSVADALDRL